MLNFFFEPIFYFFAVSIGITAFLAGLLNTSNATFLLRTSGQLTKGILNILVIGLVVSMCMTVSLGAGLLGAIVAVGDAAWGARVTKKSRPGKLTHAQR